MCQELAISFTFCKRLFIESVLPPRTREASEKDNKVCWHVVIARFGGHHSFYAEVETLLALIEGQHRVTPGDFHVLFVDERLLYLLATDESRHWQDTVKG